MSNYYEKQEGKVKIAEALMERGWKVYGYHADESDSMTDYYSPAYWNGIAVKNGFILVVDINRDEKEQKIERYNPKGNLSIEDREKITKLEAMTQENGATAGEEENAKKLIEKIKEKISDQSAYETIGFIPAHMANPGKCKWHIEKDGKIYDKGTGITKYSDIPESWEFDINKMEYTEGHKYYHEYEWIDGERHIKRIEKVLPEETRKIINDFKALILRFERVVNGMNTMGDGTKETEEKAAEQQGKAGYEKVIENITKKVIKPVQKDNITINVNDVLSFNYHGHYWIVTDIYTNAKNQKCVTYELLGSEKRGYQRLHGTSCKRYYQLESRLIKELEAGTTKIYTLHEVEEVTPVEKWVKVDKSTRKYNTDKKEEQKPQDTTKQPEQSKETIKSDIYTITADTDTRDNSRIWVVKLKNRVDAEEFNRIRNDVMKPINGYYSRFKGGFIFKYDPTSKLMPNIEQTAEEVTEQKQEETIIDNVIDFEEYKNNSEVEKVEEKEIITEQQEQEDNIFSKFDNIKINNNSRISANDEAFCKEQQEQYKQFIEFSNNYIEYLKNNSLSNIFLHSESLINKMNEKKQNNKNWFIEKIVRYFSDTYKVTLKCEPIQNKYGLDITYNTIIDEIIEQLDGYSFTDKAGKEIKDALKKQITREYDNNVRAEIKNKKVIFDDFFWIDSWDKKYGTYKVSYSSDEAFLKLLKAISHFEQGANENTYHGVYETITRKQNDDVFKEHSLMYIKAETMKLFKNGKVEVTFKTAEYARQFAKEYCGYIEKSA